MSPDGQPISLRDFYMRRNMAVVIVRDDERGRDWLESAARQQDAAAEEAGVVIAIAPPGMDSRGLPTIGDPDGTIREKLRLKVDELPALYFIDRYGKVFATNVGVSAEVGLEPSAIPGWLEFIACRCS